MTLTFPALILIYMETTTTTQTTDPIERAAIAAVKMLAGMIDARLEYAAAHGFTATDDDIAESIKASLVRMMAAAK